MSLCEALHGQLTGEEGERAQLVGGMGAARGRHGVGATGAAPSSLLPVRVKKKCEKKN
jgi:hypothetical protein